MLTTSLIQIILSKTEKRVLVIIFLIFLLIVLVIGLLSQLINKSLKKCSLEIDKHLNGYIKYGFIKNPHDFKKIGFKKNNLIFMKQGTFGVLFLLCSFILITTFCLSSNSNINYIWPIYNDMLIKFAWNWNTSSFIPYPTEWPKIDYDNSFIFYSDLSSIIAYIFLCLFIIGFIALIIATSKFIAREKRIKEKAKTLFNESLDSLDSIESLNSN